MTTHVSGQAAVATAAAQTLVSHRRAIMDMLVGHPLITTAEYDTAMQRTQACQDLATLQRWYRNTVREIARREEAAGIPVAAQAQALANMAHGIARFEARLTAQPTALVRSATAEQTSEVHRLALHRAITDSERTQALRKLPTLTEAHAPALIGALWGRIIVRRGKHTPVASVSYSSAA